MLEDAQELSTEATKQRVKEGKGSPVTNRGWQSYLYNFRLRDKEAGFWEGKFILDVGSGDKEDDPSFYFPGAKICAIDPEFGPDGRVGWNTAHEKRIGVVREIPYDDDEFDLVLSSHSVPQHIFPAEMPRAISEMLRVMKPGGEIRLMPCVKGHGDISPEVERALVNSGFEIEFIKDDMGAVTIIKTNEKLSDSSDLKREGWRNFHKAFFSKEETRE